MTALVDLAVGAPNTQVALPLSPWIIQARTGTGVTSEPATPLEWWQQAPPVLMPVPAIEAAQKAQLAGQRVVVVEASRGLWVYEQRAVTEPHLRTGQQVVGVVDEASYWHGLDEPGMTVVPRSQPIDTLWIEQPVDVGNTSPVPLNQDDLPRSTRTKSLIVDTTRPPVRWLRFAPHENEVTGVRAWVLTPKGPYRGLRVLGEPRRHAFDGVIDWSKGLEGLDQPALGTAVPVCSERAWYRWRRTGDVPAKVEWFPTELTWLE